MNNEEFKLLSISEAANLLGIGRRALRSLIAEGRIAVLIIGKRKKISSKDLNNFLESSQLLVVTTPPLQQNNSSQKTTSNDLNTILQNLIKEKQNGFNLQTG